jgi:hypothetical protein
MYCLRDNSGFLSGKFQKSRTSSAIISIEQHSSTKRYETAVFLIYQAEVNLRTVKNVARLEMSFAWMWLLPTNLAVTSC